MAPFSAATDTQTGKAEKEAQRRRQESNQRSHQEALGGETGRSSVKTGRREERSVEEVGQQEVRQEAPEDFRSDRGRHRPISYPANFAITSPDLPGLIIGLGTEHFVPSSQRVVSFWLRDSAFDVLKILQ